MGRVRSDRRRSPGPAGNRRVKVAWQRSGSAREAANPAMAPWRLSAESCAPACCLVVGRTSRPAAFAHPAATGMVVAPDRKSVVEGKSVSVRVDLGGRRFIKKQNNKNTQ